MDRRAATAGNADRQPAATARAEIVDDWVTRWPISRTDAASSSQAVATVSTLALAWVALVGCVIVTLFATFTSVIMSIEGGASLPSNFALPCIPSQMGEPCTAPEAVRCAFDARSRPCARDASD